MQYVVPSSRPMRELGAHDVLVPFTHVGLKDMPDFNKRRRRRALAREVATVQYSTTMLLHFIPSSSLVVDISKL